jgi:hypothetical protein
MGSRAVLIFSGRTLAPDSLSTERPRFRQNSLRVPDFSCWNSTRSLSLFLINKKNHSTFYRNYSYELLRVFAYGDARFCESLMTSDLQGKAKGKHRSRPEGDR